MIWLVLFEWGFVETHERRVAGFSEDVIAANETWSAMPGLSIPKIGSAVDLSDDEVEVTLQTDSEPGLTLLKFPLDSLVAKIYRCDFREFDGIWGAAVPETKVMLRGAERVADGLIKLVGSTNAPLKKDLGVEHRETCARQLGTAGCGYTPVEVTATVTGVGGYQMTVTFPAGAETNPLNYKTGLIGRDGLWGTIIVSNPAAGQFSINVPVPVSWVGQTVTIREGCDGQLSTCRDIFNNENRFLGTGYAALTYESRTGRPQ